MTMYVIMIKINLNDLKELKINESQPYNIILQKIITEYKNKSNEANLSFQHNIGSSYFYVAMGLEIALNLYNNAIKK